MARFLDPLIVQAIDEETWKLTEDLRYESDIVGPVNVRAGFITDFASVPRLPLAYLLAGNTAHAAAVIHDWLYQTKPCTKSQADRTFREAMGVTGIAPWRKNMMYAAVTVAGWPAWWSGAKRCKKLGN